MTCCAPEGSSCEDDSDCCFHPTQIGMENIYRARACMAGKCVQPDAVQNGDECSVEGQMWSLPGCDGEHTWAKCEAQENDDGIFRCVTREGHKCNSDTLCERGGSCRNGYCGFEGACQPLQGPCGWGHTGCCGGNTENVCGHDDKCWIRDGHSCSGSDNCYPGTTCNQACRASFLQSEPLSLMQRSTRTFGFKANAKESKSFTQFPIVMTHEASSFYLPRVDHFKLADQNVSVSDQLDIGARALDVRPYMYSDYTLKMMHGDGAHSQTELREVFQEVLIWTENNEDEFVIVYMQDFGINPVFSSLEKQTVRISSFQLAAKMFSSNRIFSDAWSGAKSCESFNAKMANNTLKGAYFMDETCVNGNYWADVSCDNQNDWLEFDALPKCTDANWSKMENYIAHFANGTEEKPTFLQLHFQGMRARYTESAHGVNDYIAKKLLDNKAGFHGRPLLIQIDNIANNGDKIVQAVQAIREGK